MHNKKTVILVGVAALVIAFLLSQFASPHPDGLTRVAEDLGFISQEQASPYETFLAGYQIRALGKSGLSTGLAGVAGVVLTFAITYGLSRLIRPRKN